MAAVLNAIHPAVAYPLSATEIIALVNAAILSGGASTIEALKDRLQGYNELGSDLDANGRWTSTALITSTRTATSTALSTASATASGTETLTAQDSAGAAAAAPYAGYPFAAGPTTETSSAGASSPPTSSTLSQPCRTAYITARVRFGTPSL